MSTADYGQKSDERTNVSRKTEMLRAKGNRATEGKTSARSNPFKCGREEGGFSFEVLDGDDSEVERRRSYSVHEEEDGHSSHDEETGEEEGDQNEYLYVEEVLRSGIE